MPVFVFDLTDAVALRGIRNRTGVATIGVAGGELSRIREEENPDQVGINIVARAAIARILFLRPPC